MSLVIVGIPSEDDYVWKISSEKIPHITLLFLGEPKEDFDYQDAVEFIHHTADRTLGRFGLNVERRGELGDDKADVLFFGDHNIDKLKVFRYNLLTNRHIKEAYLSAEQFPYWTPHLTLGYPESPAHPDERDYPGISWVNFDRIGIWTGDYESPEIYLNDELYNEVAMSDLASSGNDFVEHYGVKGMKWGVRRRSAREERERAKRFKAAKNRRTLSDDDLNTYISRLQQEKKLRDLVEEDLNPARAMLRGILSSSGESVARKAVSGAATLAVGAVVARKFGDQAAGVIQRGGLKK